jgi:hypothetical protein
MPRRHVQTHMIVKTDKGLVLVDKDGNQTPVVEEEKSQNKRPGKKKDNVENLP